MHLPRTRLMLAVTLWLALSPTPATAGEGGTGHYVPGTISSFMDGVSPAPVFIARINAIVYDGEFGAGRDVPIAGRIVAGAVVDSEALGFTFFWRPAWGTITEHLGTP